MSEEIPFFYLDWDYDTFSVDSDCLFSIYEAESYKDKPEYIYIEGYPTPGWHLELTMAKRILVGEDSYKYKLIAEEELK